MAGINSGSERDEANVENTSKQQSESIYTRLYNSFVQEKIEKEDVAFINRYAALDATDVSFKDEVIAFANDKKEFDELSGDEFKNKIDLGKIKSRLGSQFAKYKAERASFKQYILASYDISSDTYNTKISAKVEDLNIQEIKDLSGDLEATEQFFETSGIQKPERREIRKFLDDLNISDRISKISPASNRERVAREIAMVRENLNINNSQFAVNMSGLLQQLFQEGLINKSEKKEFIHSLVPSISLADARKVGLVSEAEMDAYISNVILDGVDDKNKKGFLNSIKQDLGNVQIDTTSIDFDTAGNITKFVDQIGFRDFAKNLQYTYLEQNKFGPESFEELLDELSESHESKIAGIENFTSGNIMEVEVSRDGKTFETEYYEIYATNSSSAPYNRVSFIKKGGNRKYFSKDEGELESKIYGDFLEFVSFTNVKKVHFKTKTEIEKEIAKGEIEEDTGTFSYLSESDKEARILRQREELTKGLESEGYMNPGDNIDDVIDNLTDDQKNALPSDIQLGLTAYENAVEANRLNLLDEINNFDKKGSDYGFEVGTSFSVKDGNDYFSIVKIEEDNFDGKISITRPGGGIEVVGFKDFLHTFKEKKGRRKALVNSGEQLVDDVNKQEDIWSGFEFKNNAIYNVSDSSNPFECEYLAGKKKNKFWGEYDILKIQSISGNTAEVQVGKSETDEKGDTTTFKTSRSTMTVTLGILSSWIKVAAMQPKNLKQENIKEDDLPEEAKLKKGVWNYYVNNFYSIPTLISAGKKYVEMWQEYLQEGNDQQVAKLLTKIPGINDEQRAAMLMMMETADKKRMDEYIDKLKILDSGPATKLIEKWLLDANTSESQKEAAVFFMCQKYGVLYEKAALMKHKGSFLWYKALGGTVGDALYRKVEAYAKESEIQFTEEDLIYNLIKEQGRGNLKPKRRGKLYKEYEAIQGNGRKDEIEKGKGDAAKKRTYPQREHFAIDELAGGGWPNAIGAMESAVGKGADGNVARLNCIPFVMMVSGAADSFFQESADAFKNGLVPTQFFCGKQSHIEAYRACVEQLVQDIEKNFGSEYKGITDAYYKARNAKTEEERVWAAYAIYNENDGKMVRYSWKSSVDAEFKKNDKEAMLETWIEDNQEEHSAYKTYFSLFQGGLGSTKDARYKEEDILKDAFSSESRTPGEGGVTGWYRSDIVKHFLQQQSGGVGFRNQDLGGMYWNEITDQIDSIAGNEKVDPGYKKKRLEKLLTGLMDGLAFSYGQRDGVLESILENRGHVFYDKFHQWGVEVTDWDKGNTNFADGSFVRGKQIIDRYIHNILTKSPGSAVEQNVNMGQGLSSISEVTMRTKDKTAQATSMQEDY